MLNHLQPRERNGERSITIYGFSVMKEAMDKRFCPASRRVEREQGEDVKFTTS